MPSDRIPNADVLIASHGRSGSTLLANLMTSAPSRVVLNEPGIGVGRIGLHVRRQLEQSGFGTTAEQDWTPRTNEEPSAFANRVLGSVLRSVDRWGVKEVNPEWIEPAIQMLRPRQIVLLVRSLPDAGMSLFNKNREQSEPHTEAWMLDRFARALCVLERVERSTDPARLCWVQYESLVGSAAKRDALAAWLDWGMTGDVGTGLAELGRGREVRLHAGRVTDASIGRYQPGQDAELDRFVERCVRVCAKAAPLIVSRFSLDQPWASKSSAA